MARAARRMDSMGSGPAVVLCHGTPFSSRIWQPFAEALSADHSVYLWDMPGYGASSMRPRAPRSTSACRASCCLDSPSPEWGLERPHVIAHDFGGAAALRAHLVHGLGTAR